MARIKAWGLGLTALTFAIAAASPIVAQPPASPASPAGPPGPDYSAIKAIIINRCVACHGPTVQRAGLRLDDREAAMKGSVNGPVIVPGHSESSKLFAMVASKRMPVDSELSVLELANLKSWIDGGALWREKRVVANLVVDPKIEAFRLALRNQDKPATAALLADPALAKARGKNATTALHQVAIYGDAAQARALLDAGADVNAADQDGVTPLIWAVRDDAVALLLIDRGADVNATSDADVTPLVAAAGRTSGTAVVRRLIEKGVKPTMGQMAQMGASAGANGALETIRLLFPKVIPANGPGATAASATSMIAECTACVDYLIAQGAKGATLSDALVMAANWGDAALVKRLIDQGAALDGHGPQGATVLISATLSDREPAEKVRLLLAAGADVNAPDAHGRTPLIYARQIHPEIAPALIAKGAK